MSTTDSYAPSTLRIVTTEIPGLGRSIAAGAAIGSVLAFVGVAGAIYFGTHDGFAALGVGAMASFWGGLGFGTMLGGTLHLIRHSDDPYEPEGVAPRSDAVSRSDAPRPEAEEIERVVQSGGVRDVVAASSP